MIYDTAIIGLGPAGLKFAQEALKSGLKVIAFEKTSVGGTCLNLGCVPTKTMLSCAEVFSKMNICKKFGIQCADEAFSVSYEKMCEKKNKIVTKLSESVLKDLKNKGLEFVAANAQIKIDGGKAIIAANNKEFEALNIIAATGSKPRELDGLKFDGEFILNSNDILNLSQLPKSVLIVGSGAIGVEWARIFNSLNVDVTLVEAAQTISPSSDIDISARIERIFKISRIKFYKNTTVLSVNKKTVKLSNNTELNADIILVAAGREKVLPEFCDNFKLQIFDNCKTNVENLYVIGDASNIPMLAHAASYQAHALFLNLYKNKPIKMPPVPSVIYGNPEIASIGICEQDLPQNWQQDSSYKIYKLPVSYLPKAWCDDEIEGFIKIITKDNKIIGAHIVSKEASALIAQAAIAMKADMNVDDFKEIIFAHPTYSEGICEALNNG